MIRNVVSVLRSIAAFFVREKIYAFFFVIVIGFYGYMWLHSPQVPKKTKTLSAGSSQALEDFRKAEARLTEKINKAGSLKEYLRERPALEIVFHLLSLGVFAAFACGLILDGFWFFNPKWRERFQCWVQDSLFRWKFSMLFKVVLLFLTSGILLSLFLGFIQTLMHGNMQNFYVLIHTTLADILCFVFITMLVRREGGRLSDLGLRVPSGSFFQEVRVGLGFYLGILPMFVLTLVILVLISSLLHFEPEPHPLVSVFLEEQARSPFLIVYSIFLATVVGPIFEELFFRGFCYPIFKQHFGTPLAMVLTASFFALIHENTFAFWPIFILGLGLVYLYEKRGSLVAPMALHVVHNTIFISYFFLAKNVILQESGG